MKAGLWLTDHCNVPNKNDDYLDLGDRNGGGEKWLILDIC